MTLGQISCDIFRLLFSGVIINENGVCSSRSYTPAHWNWELHRHRKWRCDRDSRVEKFCIGCRRDRKETRFHAETCKLDHYLDTFINGPRSNWYNISITLRTPYRTLDVSLCWMASTVSPGCQSVGMATCRALSSCGFFEKCCRRIIAVHIVSKMPAVWYVHVRSSVWTVDINCYGIQMHQKTNPDFNTMCVKCLNHNIE